MLAKHHEAWLIAHPERSAQWFRRVIADGFDVHHLDGDHDNNDPSNLALIEYTDHQAVIHGHKVLRRLIKPVPLSNIKRCADIAEDAYDLYSVGDKTWAQIADDFGVERWQTLLAAVADYAKIAGRK